MDESLDDYISKTNFRVRIGNQGLQTKKRGYQGNQVTDVSITVPAVKKTGLNINRTNQTRDARERLVSKTKPVDAREKLNQKAQNTDARQKLNVIRSQKEPLDARAKIQAKKQGQMTAGPGQAENFTLTRTVSNNNNNNIQLTPGPSGNIHVTKTLTKVMPPGYERIIGAPVNTAPSQQIPPHAGAKNRLGPSAAPASNVPTLTRTITNPPSRPQHPGFPPPPHSVQVPRQIVQVPQAPSFTQTVPPQSSAVYPHPVPSQPYAAVSQPYPQPAPPMIPPASVSVQAGYMSAVPPSSVFIGQQPAPAQYVQQPALPKVQVQNDQYRPPGPQYQHHPVPTQPQYTTTQYASAQPQAPTPQPQYPQHVYQPPHSQPTYYAPAPSPPPEAQMYEDAGYFEALRGTESFKRTIVNDAPAPELVNRKAASESSRLSTSGPLRSSATNYVPIIETTRRTESVKTQKFQPTKITAPGEPVAKRLKEEDDESNVISPIQGYKVLISNLASTVTQDDLVELFGAMGAVKRVKLVKHGVGEVVYVKKDDAARAMDTYHERELDGQAMSVKVMTPASARIKAVPDKLPASEKPVVGSPLKFNKGPSSKTKSSGDKTNLDVMTLHKALFKTGSSSSSKPVTFTVNI